MYIIKHINIYIYMYIFISHTGAVCFLWSSNWGPGCLEQSAARVCSCARVRSSVRVVCVCARGHACMRTCACVCACSCARACLRARARANVRACPCVCVCAPCPCESWRVVGRSVGLSFLLSFVNRPIGLWVVVGLAGGWCLVGESVSFLSFFASLFSLLVSLFSLSPCFSLLSLSFSLLSSFFLFSLISRSVGRSVCGLRGIIVSICLNEDYHIYENCKIYVYKNEWINKYINKC